MCWFRFKLATNNYDDIEKRVNEILEQFDTIHCSDSMYLWQHQDHPQKFLIDVPEYIFEEVPYFIFMEDVLNVVLIPWVTPDLSE